MTPYGSVKVDMPKILEIQPAVITTFALSDLMALSDGLSLRTNTACLPAPS